MSLNANDQEGGGDFTPQEALEPGSYPARLVQVVEMGVQNSRPFKGQPKPPRNRIYLTYELSHEFMVDDNGNPDPTKPRWHSEDMPFYNLDMTTAKSTERYAVFDPQVVCEGDWRRLLGMPCQVTLTKEPRKDGKGFTNYVSHVGSPINLAGYVQPELVNKPRMFDLDTPDMEMWAQLPKWLQDRIKQNLNYNGSPLQAALGEPYVPDAQVPTTTAAPAPTAPQPPAPAAPAAPVAPAPPPATAAPPPPAPVAAPPEVPANVPVPPAAPPAVPVPPAPDGSS